MLTAALRLVLLASCALATAVHAQSWNYWGQVNIQNPQAGGSGAQLATGGTNIYFSTLLDGVYRASLDDRNFLPMPMTGFPLWDANVNTNGFALQHLVATPQGTVVISGSQISVASNTITFNPPGSSANTVPVFYWWDETNQLWHASTVTNKSYPYTGNVGNFSVAPDGALWACSGFYPYAYRSLDGGRSFTAFDINARVPTNYLPMPSGQTTFGEVFSILATPKNEIVIGTETGGFLHSTNNGTNWTSLDPNYTSTNSVNPLGRIGDARIAGLDHYGNVLLNNYQMSAFPGFTNWNSVQLIGWRPADGAYFPATNGFLAQLGSGRIVTPTSGTSFVFMNQNYLLQGGIYRSANGRDWTQFNQGSGLDVPFAPGLTNVLGAGGPIVALGNEILISTGSGTIYSFDSTPPPITNRPPRAFAQNVTLWENAPTNILLSGTDADGDALNFTIVTSPHGLLSGTPPDLTYTPSNNFTGLDFFWVVADDGKATSAPVVINLVINAQTNTLSNITLLSPANGSVFVGPTNLVLAASATDPDGIRTVNFYSANTLIGVATNAPYTFVLTNLSPGEYIYSARAIDNQVARTWSQPASISVLPVAPRLKIQQSDTTNVSISWPLDLDGFFLESASTISGPWTLNSSPPLFLPAGQITSVSTTNEGFFRLMRP